MYNPKEQLFAEELGRMRLAHQQAKKRQRFELEKTIKKEAEILAEEKANKKFFGRISFFQKLRKARDNFKNNFEAKFVKYKRSDNLATQVQLSRVEYVVPLAAAAVGAGGAAGGAAAGGAAAGGAAAEAGGAAAGSGITGNIGKGMSGLGEEAGGSAEERFARRLAKEAPEKKEEETEEGEEPATALPAMPAGAPAGAGGPIPQAPGMPSLPWQTPGTGNFFTDLFRPGAVSDPLMQLKIGLVTAGWPTFAFTSLIAIIIWILQFILYYFIKLRSIFMLPIPAFCIFDLFFFVQAAFQVLIIGAIIFIFMSIMCKLDITGLVC